MAAIHSPRPLNTVQAAIRNIISVRPYASVHTKFQHVTFSLSKVMPMSAKKFRGLGRVNSSHYGNFCLQFSVKQKITETSHQFHHSLKTHSTYQVSRENCC